MKRTLMFIALVAAFSVSTFSQQKVVHFRKLQEFLPTITMEGLERQKPTGSTQTAFGMSTSEAEVDYRGSKMIKQEMVDDDGKKTMEEVEVSVEVSVKISDISLIPMAAMAYAFQQEYENETEDGYEKSTVVKKNYKGIEKQQTGDYQSCELTFPVGNRFLVELRGNYIDDVKILHKLAESMDLAKLEKTTP